MNRTTKIVGQQCSKCGRVFSLLYTRDGYTYLDDPCDCGAEFFSLGPSYLEWLQEINEDLKEN